MHDTAAKIGQLFFQHYVERGDGIVIDVGALDVNGSLRKFCPEGTTYLGVDLEHGESVDIVVRPEEPLPFRNDFADVVVSTSQMEHDTFFWESFCEYARIVKPGGYIYINAPSNGIYHRFPNDNWRFYPDCGHALAQWARKNKHAITLVESFVADREHDIWNDFVGVFAKEPLKPRDACLSDLVKCRNVWKSGAKAPTSLSMSSEDQDKIKELTSSVAKLRLTASREGAAATTISKGAPASDPKTPPPETFVPTAPVVSGVETQA